MNAPSFLLACLLALPARAQDDASFAASLSALGGLSTEQAAQDIARRRSRGRYLRLIGSKLSWYGRAGAQAGMGTGELSQEAVFSLRSGKADCLVLGESHGDPLERQAAHALLAAVLDAGVPVGAFLQEASTVMNADGRRGDPAGIFPLTKRLEEARVPLLLMANQFDPDKDIEAGLRAAAGKTLVTYSGSAHTSERMRDLIIETLKLPDMRWGRLVPGRPVIERSLRRRGRAPLVVAMAREAQILGAVEAAVLSEASKGASAGEWARELAEAEAAWTEALSAFPPSSGMRFMPVPEQEGFFIGMSPSERRPLALRAALETARLPEFAAWLGGARVKEVSALRSSWDCGEGAPCSGIEVSVDKGGPERFRRRIALRD